MPKQPDCVDCIKEDIPNWRPTTGVRVKRCASHVRAKKMGDKLRKQTNRHRDSYSLTPEDVIELMGEQNGLCAICGPVTGNRGASRALSTDHDHKCCATGSNPISCGKCVRGFLCGGCNTFLGRIRDSIEVAARMVLYLQDPPWQRVQRRRSRGPGDE